MKTSSLFLFSLVALALTATHSDAAKMPKLDSSAFDFKYEMETLPSAEDLDNDGTQEIIKACAMGNDENCVIIGVGSKSYGGSFELDYVRWTTDGVFAPVTPPMATALCIL